MSRDEAEQAIEELKNTKVPGKDSIITKLWKYVDNRTIDILTKIIQDFWFMEEIPAELSTL